MRKLYLWKYNSTTGYWSVGREVTPENSKEWLKVWRDSAPNYFFVIRKISQYIIQQDNRVAIIYGL